MATNDRKRKAEKWDQTFYDALKEYNLRTSWRGDW